MRSLAGEKDNARYFQISATIRPGNSGGAVVDARGDAIGMISDPDPSGNPSKNGLMPDYAVKGSFLVSFLDSVPEVAAKLKKPATNKRGLEDSVKAVRAASVKVIGLVWMNDFE